MGTNQTTVHVRKDTVKLTEVMDKILVFTVSSLIRISRQK